MPHFFFHIWSRRGQATNDLVGVSLPDGASVLEEAARQALCHAVAARDGGPDYSGCWFEIEDSERRRFITAPAFHSP